MALKKTKVNCLIIILKNKKYIFAYPLIKKSKAHKGLQKFFIDVGIPSKVVGDPGGEFMGEEQNSIIRRFHVAKGKTETQSQWQNRAEKAIQSVKEMSTRILDNSGAPEKYWTFVVLYAAQIINHSAHPSLSWRTPHECVFGDTSDVSVFWGFKFWQK